MGNKSGKSKKKDLTVLTEDEIKFLLKNTTFTEEQIHHWHKQFLLDCPKGELDKKKFLAVYQEFFPRGKSEKFSNEVFKLFDTDHSGKIDFTEFLVAISTSDKGDLKTKLHLAFNLYDSNHNGKIDKKEFEKILIAIYDLKGIESRKGENDPKTRTADIFSKMDKDFTNTLSEEEFVNGCMQDHVLMKFLNPQF